MERTLKFLSDSETKMCEAYDKAGVRYRVSDSMYDVLERREVKYDNIHHYEFDDFYDVQKYDTGGYGHLCPGVRGWSRREDPQDCQIKVASEKQMADWNTLSGLTGDRTDVLRTISARIDEKISAMRVGVSESRVHRLLGKFKDKYMEVADEADKLFQEIRKLA